jgi:hypothetical protein
MKRCSVLLSCCLVAWSVAAQPTAPAASHPTPPVSTSLVVNEPLAQRLLDEFGVELQSLNLTASGFMVDLRYRVKDAQKARKIAEREIRPFLIKVASNDRFYVPQAPKVGQLRQTVNSKQVLQVDRVYFLMFANPDRRIEAGDKVRLQLGDTTIDNLEVAR